MFPLKILITSKLNNNFKSSFWNWCCTLVQAPVPCSGKIVENTCLQKCIRLLWCKPISNFPTWCHFHWSSRHRTLMMAPQTALTATLWSQASTAILVRWPPPWARRRSPRGPRSRPLWRSSTTTTSCPPGQCHLSTSHVPLWERPPPLKAWQHQFLHFLSKCLKWGSIRQAEQQFWHSL